MQKVAPTATTATPTVKLPADGRRTVSGRQFSTAPQSTPPAAGRSHVGQAALQYPVPMQPLRS